MANNFKGLKPKKYKKPKPEKVKKPGKEKTDYLGLIQGALPFIALICATWAFYDWQSVLLYVNSPYFMEFSKEIRAVVGVTAWIILAYGMARVVDDVFWDGIVAFRTGRPAPQLLRGVFAMLIYLVAFASIITFVFERSPAFLFAATGGAGIVVGFAVQALIADFFAGIVLTVQQPFVIGDFVEINGVYGTVDNINWRVTTLLNPEDRLVSIPNSAVARSTVINATHAGNIRMAETIEIDYDVPVERVMRVLRAAVESVPEVPGRVSTVETMSMNENGVTYRIRFWAHDDNDWFNALERNLGAVQTHLQSAGIRYSRSVHLNPSSKLEYEPPNESGRRQLLLSKVQIFENLDQQELDLLVDGVIKRSYEKGDDIVQQSAPGESMFILASGIAEILIRFGAGQEPTKVAELDAGKVFGEVSLLTGENRTATVQAKTDIEVYEIAKPLMAKLFDKRPEMVDELARIMAVRQIQSEMAKENFSRDEAKSRQKSTADQMLGKIRGFFKNEGASS